MDEISKHIEAVNLGIIHIVEEKRWMPAMYG